MAIHCLESGWIGKYAPWGNLHLLALEMQIASGVVFSNASLLLAVYYYNVALGEEMYCKLHPNWLGSIDSVEFNVTLSLWKRNDYHCAAEQQL